MRNAIVGKMICSHFPLMEENGGSVRNLAMLEAQILQNIFQLSQNVNLEMETIMEMSHRQ